MRKEKCGTVGTDRRMGYKKTKQQGDLELNVIHLLASNFMSFGTGKIRGKVFYSSFSFWDLCKKSNNMSQTPVPFVHAIECKTLYFTIYEHMMMIKCSLSIFSSFFLLIQGHPPSPPPICARPLTVERATNKNPFWLSLFLAPHRTLPWVCAEEGATVRRRRRGGGGAASALFHSQRGGNERRELHNMVK